jgi:uncharacterized repeat protein (TIGR03803 family)
VILSVLIVSSMVAPRAMAQGPTGTETAIYSFCAASNCTDGQYPKSNLMQAADGNYYGTTTEGGAYDSGAIYKLTPTGAYSVLYSFTGNDDGGFPVGGLVQGSDGFLYGTSAGYGADGAGTIFKISLSGNFTLLYSFTGGNDGGQPKAPLVLASDGNFYGTAEENGPDRYYGDLFSISPGGDFTVLYGFSGGSDGGQPQDGLVQGMDGYLYGTTSSGSLVDGTLFQYIPSSPGTVNTLYTFTGDSDGANPYGGLVQGPDGTFYGATQDGASSSCQSQVVHGPRYTSGGCGALYSFKLTEVSAGTLTPLYELDTSASNPLDTLIFGSDGNLYGTTNGGGNGSGTLIKLTTSGTLTEMYDFCSQTGCSDGESPYAGLVQGSDGNFYGTTAGDGGSNSGAVFQFTPATALSAPVQLSAPSSAATRVPVTVNFQSSNSFSLSMQQCFAFATDNTFGSFYVLGPVTATMTDGIYSGTFTETTGVYGSYLVAVTCGGVETGLATVEVGKTSLSLSAGSSNFVSGQTATLTAAVSEVDVANVNEGNVSLTCGSESFGTQTVSASGVAQFAVNTAGLAAGNYGCTARYSDLSAHFAPSSATESFGVQNQTSSVSLNPNGGTVRNGVSTSVTATVTGEISTPTSGLVHFVGGSVDFGYIPLNSSGQATLTVDSTYPVGTYTVTATYLGTAGTSGSSASAQFTVESGCKVRGKVHPEC